VLLFVKVIASCFILVIAGLSSSRGRSWSKMRK
jgi:hypothetical protein